MKKNLIILASALVFLGLLIVLYFYLVKANSVPDASPTPESKAETNLNKAREAMQNMQNDRPMRQADFSQSETFDEGGIKIVKNKDFQYVADRPKTPEQVLMEMAENKNKETIKLSDTDLKKKIQVEWKEEAKTPQKTSKVPSPGEELDKPKKSMITAPVNYKIFKEDKDWKEFSNTHKIREIKPEFPQKYVLILVSMSELPNGIFKITAVENTKDGLIISYQIDPMEMSSSNPDRTYNHYSAVNIPKTEKITLQQVP